MKPHTLLTFVAIILFFSSCDFNPNNCTGSTEVRDTALVFSNTNVDTVYTQNGRYRHTIGWEVASSYIDRNDASKNCRNKVGPQYIYTNPILDSTITLVCSQDLSWYGKKVIYAGTNLLGPALKETGLVKETIPTGAYIDADSIKTGLYIYTISAVNKWGEHLSDTIQVSYR